MKIGRLLFYSLTSGSGLYLGQKVYKDGRIDLNNVGVIRFGRAAWTVGRIGVDYKLSLFSSSSPVSGSKEYEDLVSKTHYRSANRLLDLCNANGGCFTKVGQHIGALDYLLPEEYTSTMKVLHSQAPKMDYEDIFAVLKEELGPDAENLFEEFDEKPLGVASLAQVHRVKVKKTGEEGALKIQHRYVKSHSFVDIYTMEFLVKVVNYVFPQFEFMWLADEMKKNLPLELNFLQEGRNAEKVSNLLSHLPYLRVPKIHWSLSTERVLFMEYLEGGHIDDIQYMKDNKINLNSVSKYIGEMYAEMIFHNGYVHCDPHPGNVLVRKNRITGKDEVVLLDHGLYTQLTNDFRYNYAQFWHSILKADLEGIKQSADCLGVGNLYGLFACMVTGRSWGSIQKGIDKAEKNSAESKEIKENAARYVKEITDVLAFVNRQMILIFKTNDLLRNIEFSLGTQNSMSSLVQMSRACMKVLRAEERKKCQNNWCLIKSSIGGQLDQLKISFYQLFLTFYWSRLGNWIFGRA